MKILLYGGTFDPPHYGHMHNIETVAALAAPDLVIVMPAGVPPHKAASATPAALRLEMCGCFAALAGTPSIPRLEISDWEIRQAAQGAVNYTVRTLEMLAARWPGAQLFLAMGSDMLLSFEQWHEWQRILQLAALVVESRENGDRQALEQAAARFRAAGGRVLLAQRPALPMASHLLRARMAAGDPCEEALPPLVRAVIRREGLYGCSRDPQPDT